MRRDATQPRLHEEGPAEAPKLRRDFSLIQMILAYTEKEMGDIMWEILVASKEHRLTRQRQRKRKKIQYVCNYSHSSFRCLLGTTRACVVAGLTVERTFESRLFRSRMGLCRKTICLVDTLPSLHRKEGRTTEPEFRGGVESGNRCG